MERRRRDVSTGIHSPKDALRFFSFNLRAAGEEGHT